MRGGPVDGELASESDYARAAESAHARGDLKEALAQIGAALTFAPLASERLALLDAILASTPRPLDLLPDRGDVFFGTAALRGLVLARARKWPAAIETLLDVAIFRPAIPYLVWLDHSTTSPRSLRGVPADGTAARIVKLAGQFDALAPPPPGAITNLACAERLLDDLCRARPAAAQRLAVLRSMLLRRLGRTEEARALVDAFADEGNATGFELRMERAAVRRALGDLPAARDILQSEARTRPEDVAVRLDLGDVLLENGDIDEAEQAYGAALALEGDPGRRDRIEAQRAHAAVLVDPGDEARWLSLDVIASKSEYARALRDDLLGYGATAIAITDPVADVIRSAVARAEQAPATSPLVVRVRLDAPPPRSAHLALGAALERMGRDGRLVVVLGDSEILPPAAPARAFSNAVLERIEELAHSPFDLEAWCTGPTISVDRETLEPLLDTAAASAGADPIERLQRTRMAVMAVGAREGFTPDATTIAWLSQLARDDDAWLGACAIAVLTALARRRSGLATRIASILTGMGEPDDARRDALAHGLVLLPAVDGVTRRRAQAWRRRAHSGV